MGFLKKVEESIKKTANTIGEEIKTRQEISQTKRQILNRFEMKDLINICKDYGIGGPSPSKKELVTGKDGKLYLTNRKIPARREHYSKKIMTELNLEQIKNFADKHRIDMPDIVKKEKKPIRRIEEIKEQPKEKKIVKTEIKQQSEFDSILENIKNNFVPEACRDEKEFEKQLISYLKGRLSQRVVGEVASRKGKIDIVIDDKYAIELKIANSISNLRNLIGQIHDYLKVYNDLAVIILDVGDLSRSDINDYVDDYQELGTKVIVLAGVLKRRKRRSRQFNRRH